jgi:hypothetical protein
MFGKEFVVLFSGKREFLMRSKGVRGRFGYIFERKARAGE